MRSLGSILLGFCIAILSSSIILGSLSLAMLEGNLSGNPPVQLEPSLTALMPTIETIIPGTTQIYLPLTITTTLPSTPAFCPPSVGWIPITVQQNENLDILAQRYNSSIELLSQANCLLTASITSGSILYVPPLPTPTLIPCGPPAGWITYIVKRHDTLFCISSLYQTTVPQLQAANCLGTSTLIITGQSLYVPNVPTISPTITTTPTISLTPSPTQTSTQVTPSPTSTASPTSTSTPTPTDTPTPTSTFTPLPTLG